MHMQPCSCVRKLLPRNPNFLFSFVLILPSHVCLFSFFSYAFMLSMPMFHMFNCLVCYHMLELGFILFLLFWWHEHAFTCSFINAIGNAHAFVIWSCFGEYACLDELCLIKCLLYLFFCLCFCLDLIIHVAALNMIWYARWMLGWCDEMYVKVCYDVIWFVMKHVRCMLGDAMIR